ncbi:MAG: VirB3 family type IV secretion system protein [Bryobacteraceae bacterium]
MTTPSARALNKPLLIIGLDRKLLGLAFILCVVVGANGSRVAAAMLFLALCAMGRRLTRRDPNLFMVLNQVRKQKVFYDPVKREWFRISLRQKTE